MEEPQLNLHDRIANLYGTHLDLLAPTGPRQAHLYRNAGYWLGAANDQDAARRNLVSHCLGRLEVEPGDHVLDVACGYGASTVLATSVTACEQATGVDLLDHHIDHARKALDELNPPHALRFETMDATRLGFPDASFDRIFSVDAAFHFVTRQRFFEEAVRVLRKPRGRIALVDLVFGSEFANSPARGQLSRFWAVPEENLSTSEQYRKILEDSGFDDVTIESIGEAVVPGFCDFVLQESYRNRFEQAFGWEAALELKQTFRFMRAAYAKQLFDYVLVSARVAANRS